MPNVFRYFIALVVLLSLTKIIQVTAFDSKHFEKLKKEEKIFRDRKETPIGKKKQKELVKKKSDAVEIVKNQLKPAPKDSFQSTSKPAIKTYLSILKNEYLNPLLEKIPVGHLREDIVIRYYKHKKDGNGVRSLHDELAYYIHEKEAKETAGLGSNVIYYGDDVPLEDIQIVALTLLEKGISIKAIEHTKFDWKVKAIEIGTDLKLLNDSTITAEQIMAFHKQYLKNGVLVN